ncbi:cyclase family protein [Paenibacillus koleovorans]|uniref:cyclase family protein n=1 Tax=Paenibacillus koleovorans TaxID=121608 RepID=UPI000FDCCA6B|nr:cyclase family protein [Paenibacillus koleovorans]
MQRSLNRIHDLASPIMNGIWGYGDPFPPVRIDRIASVEKEGFSAHHLNIHSLAGTYIETAEHFYSGRETIDSLPIDRYVARAWIAELSEKEALEPVTAAELEAAVGELVQPGDALLVSTGWERMWNKPGYVDQNPFLLKEAMEWIIEKKIGILAVDMPHAQDPRADDGELLRMLYAEERLLLAPLVNMRGKGKGPFTLVALPLHIPGVCSTPCRPILIEGSQML